VEKLLYKGRGGLRMGDFDDYAGLNIGWPLAIIKITEKNITLNYSKRFTLRFSRDNVDSIAIYKGIFSKGIRIFHHKKNERAFIVFGTYKASKLLKLLRENGWPVKYKEKPKRDNAPP